MNGQSHASILFRRLLRERLRLCLFCISVTFLCVFALTVAQNTCNMERNLGALLVFAREFFEANKVTWWVDYGTLLGAIREQRILPFEFDLDLAIQDFDTPKLYAQRDFVESRGFFLYKRDEFVPNKKTFYGTGGDGFLRSPGLRIYDRCVGKVLCAVCLVRICVLC